MNITLPLHISTITYNTNTEPYTLSFITDLKYNKEYTLSGDMSLLWEYIIKTGDYDLIRKYAENNKQSEIVDDFLSQLKDKKIIDMPIEFTANKLSEQNCTISHEVV